MLEDIAFAGIASREGLVSEEELDSALQLLESLERIGIRSTLHGVLTAEGRLDIALTNRILAHQNKEELDCPSCENTENAIVFPLKPVFRCGSCSTELPLPPGIRTADVDNLRAKIAEVLLWHEAESLAGQTLGSIQLLTRIGQGPMGGVYDAVRLESDQRVAIRVLPKALGQSAAYLECFRFEADVMTRVNHPNIVKVHRIGEERGRQFVVMERVAGNTLQQVFAERGPLPVKDAISVITQAAQGIQAGHERGLIHRDLKPGNIFLTDKGIVKVADFGIAQNRQETADAIGTKGPGVR